MLLRVFILFFICVSSQYLCAQGADTPTLVQEEIEFKPISKKKQKIYNREFSIEPDSYISRDGRQYAQWNLSPGAEPINIKVITVIEKLNNEPITLGKRKKHTFIETEGGYTNDNNQKQLSNTLTYSSRSVLLNLTAIYLREYL